MFADLHLLEHLKPRDYAAQHVKHAGHLHLGFPLQPPTEHIDNLPRRNQLLPHNPNNPTQLRDPYYHTMPRRPWSVVSARARWRGGGGGNAGAGVRAKQPQPAAERMPRGSSAPALPLAGLNVDTAPLSPCERTSRTFPPAGATLNAAHVLGPQGTADATPTA